MARAVMLAELANSTTFLPNGRFGSFWLRPLKRHSRLKIQWKLLPTTRTVLRNILHDTHHAEINMMDIMLNVKR
jgi:hypothetical protein